MIRAVGNRDGALIVHHNAPQHVQVCSGAKSVCKARRPVACKRRDGATERDLAQGVVIGVRHEQVTLAVHRDAERAVEAGLAILSVFEARLRLVPRDECLSTALQQDEDG